jgi:Sec-independent protein translocase protein TatA
MADRSNTNNAIIAILAIAVVVILAFVFLGAKDNRGTGERIGDAVTELERSGSPSQAVEQLEDRNAAERAADAVGEAADEAAEDFREATQ